MAEFKIVEGQIITVRQNVEFHGTRESDPDYFYYADGPVKLKVIDVYTTPADGYVNYYNVDVEVLEDPICAGDRTNMDVTADDLVI
jgi:hypothetical protein